MFRPNIYQARRKVLMEAMGEGLLLFPGNEESPMNYADNVYHFRQDGSFLYYFGIDRPGYTGIIDAGSGQAWLAGPEMTIDHIVWMGPQPSLAERAAQCGAEQTLPIGEAGAFLQKAQKAGQAVHFLPPYRGEAKLQLSAWLGQPAESLSPSLPLIKAVVAQRAVKGGEEIEEMEKALAISRELHVRAMQVARPGMKEAALAGMVEGIALGAESALAYPPILTVNGQTLHNHYHGNPLQEGQLVLGDFGASAPHTHYASDITRTFPVSKAFSQQQKEVYQIVLDAEESCIAGMKPGIRFVDLHLQAARIITEGLKALGLMKGDTEEAVAAGAHALFFPHGLGHMIGLDVHDMEGLGEEHVGYAGELERSAQFGLKSLRMGRALQPGHVMTVEPGIYFIPELIQKWQADGLHAPFLNYDKINAYLGFGGIRIEDNILVTADGQRVLGPAIPKRIEEVEALRP